MKRSRQLAEKGSEKWIRRAVNCYPAVLDDCVKQRLSPTPNHVGWLSPLKCDKYTEYSDQKFICRLGLNLKCSLNEFWPNKGPNWDGLAKTDRCQALLVEAKSHIAEMRSGRSRAKSCKSKELIGRSLKRTQEFLKADPRVDWARSPYYQYANRLAHLYFLAERNGIDAYLLMVYFLNDSERNGPCSVRQWKCAIRNQYSELGLPDNNGLSDRIVELFLDVREFGA